MNRQGASPSESKPVKPEGETADASRRITAGLAKRGQQASASLQVAAAQGASRKLQQQTAKAGGCSSQPS